MSSPIQQPEFVAITSSRSRNSESQTAVAQGGSPKAETLPFRFPNNNDLENSELSLYDCDPSNSTLKEQFEGNIEESPRDQTVPAIQKLPLNPIQEMLRGEEDEENPPEPLRIKPPEPSFTTEADNPYQNNEGSPKNLNSAGRRVVALNESSIKQMKLHEHLLVGKERRKQNRSQPVALEEQNTTTRTH